MGSSELYKHSDGMIQGGERVGWRAGGSRDQGAGPRRQVGGGSGNREVEFGERYGEQSAIWRPERTRADHAALNEGMAVL